MSRWWCVWCAVALGVLAALAPVAGQCTAARARAQARRGVWEWSAALARRAALAGDAHFLSGGASLWALLAAASLGAAGPALRQLAAALRLHPHDCFNDKYYRLLGELARSPAAERSAALFVNDRIRVSDEFVYAVDKSSLSAVRSLSFRDPGRAAAVINDYVAAATHDSIKEIVTPADLDNALIIMIDALFFRGVWKKPFPYTDTEVSKFYNDRGNHIGYVNLMLTSGVFNVSSIKQIQARVLELPYGNDPRYSMLVLLPYTDVTVSTVIEKLSDISLRTIFAKFKMDKPDDVAVQLPRFKITSDVNLKELMIDMGIVNIFDPNNAMFDELSSDNVYVSNLIQKAIIEVTEEGTTAVVVSEAEMSSRAGPQQFIVNKPFVFIIADRQTELPLFFGAYSKPSEF